MFVYNVHCLLSPPPVINFVFVEDVSVITLLLCQVPQHVGVGLHSRGLWTKAQVRGCAWGQEMCQAGARVARVPWRVHVGGGPGAGLL